MSVSFEVQKSDMSVTRLMSRPCYASINSVLTTRDRQANVSIRNVRYLPFLQRAWCLDADATIDQHQMQSRIITWEDCYKWWDYLMTLPFVTDVLRNAPTTHVAMKDGFTVKSEFPADRVMCVLFLLRAPQYQTGIIQDWIKLVDKEKINPDTATVIAFILNRFTNHEGCGKYYLNSQSSSESTIIYPEYFTLKSAKLMLNRLLCEDYDKDLYKGSQPNLNVIGRYKRHPATSPSALGRFLCKKPSKSLRDGNVQVGLYCDQRNDYEFKVTTHALLSAAVYRGEWRPLEIDVHKLAKLLEA